MQKITVAILFFLLSLVTCLGCGGQSDLVNFPDEPVPKPDNITVQVDSGSVESE